MKQYLRTSYQNKLFFDRFAQRDYKTGELLEHSAEDMFRRIAEKTVSANDKTDTLTVDSVFNFFINREFITAGRILANVGGNGTNMSGNCFTIPIEDSRGGIMKCQADTMEIHAKGGGVGTNFSTLRPRGAIVHGVRGESSGPCSFLNGFDAYGLTIKQGGSRRAARMTILNVDHPDIYEFINAKKDPGVWTTTNISVGVTDKFMEAVENDEQWDLQFDGKVYNTVSARNLFEDICKNAHDNGEPGIIFLDTINEKYPLAYRYKITACNPCQPRDTLVWDVDRLRYITDQDACSWDSWRVGEKEVLELTTNTGMKIRCTPEHKVILKDGSKYPAKDCLGKELLQPNDRGFLYYLAGESAIELIPEEIVRGFLFGGGFICGKGLGVSVKLNPEKEPEVAEYLEWFGFHRQNSGAFYMNRKEVEEKIDISFLNDRVWEREIPEDVITGKPHSFLRGLYAANGSCNKKNGQISLKTTNRKIAEQVQILLGSLGIHASIATNKPAKVEWHNGSYVSKESFNVQTPSSYGLTFQEKVGFFAESRRRNIREAKNNRVKIFVQNIDSLGIQEVWDYQMKNPPHSNYCQGTILGNCGERPQPDYSMCILGSLILSSFVNEDKEFDWDRFRKAVCKGVQILDNIIDVSTFPIPEIEDMVKKTRPIGLGVMGLADALFMMEIPYGKNKRCLDFLSELGSTMYSVAKAASEEIAERKGAFPDYDSELASFPPRRNATLLSFAPTGTVAGLAGVSYGIEPHFAASVIKDEELGKDVISNPVLNDWLRENKVSDLPEWARFAVTNNPKHQLDVFDHLEPLSVLAEWVDAGISKTINLPKTATVEDVANAYMFMWESGIKGGTVYRDGCRENQPLNDASRGDVDDGSDEEDDECTIEFIESWREPEQRPEKLEGTTYRIRPNPNGPWLYITINDYDDTPFEIFFTSRDATHQEYLDIISDIMTTLYRRGEPGIHIVRDLLKHQSNSGGGWYHNQYIPSTAAAIGMILKEHYQILGLMPDDAVTSKEIQKLGLDDNIKSAMRCPECGEYKLIMVEGCNMCTGCGYSKCG